MTTLIFGYLKNTILVCCHRLFPTCWCGLHIFVDYVGFWFLFFLVCHLDLSWRISTDCNDAWGGEFSFLLLSWGHQVMSQGVVCSSHYFGGLRITTVGHKRRCCSGLARWHYVWLMSNRWLFLGRWKTVAGWVIEWGGGRGRRRFDHAVVVLAGDSDGEVNRPRCLLSWR